MHKQLRKALDSTTGVSEFVIAVFVDVRDFSPFAKTAESPDIAMFIKRVYIELLDNYFKSASFFKTTGDGLMLTFPYTARDLKKTSQQVVGACLKAVDHFASFCEKDSMVTIEVPKKLGIGIARGTACRLISRNKTLDYTGRVLNLASRLMDLARPEGVVLDGGFDLSNLRTDQISQFGKKKVYLKGVAEAEPVSVFYSKEYTKIHAAYSRPPFEVQWQKDLDKKKLKNIARLGTNFHYELQGRPADENQISIKISYPCVRDGKRIEGIQSFFYYKHYLYYQEGEHHYVTVDFADVARRLKEKGVKERWDVNVEIKYPL